MHMKYEIADYFVVTDFEKSSLERVVKDKDLRRI